MTQAFMIDDHGRFGRILLFVILVHLLLLVGMQVFPQTHPPLKRKMASLFEVSPKVSLNIAPQQTASPTDKPSLTAVAPTVPRRKVMAAAPHNAQDLDYLVKWQAYVESYGNAYYSKTIVNKQLQGNLRLMVAINRDGSLREVTVRQSSGSSILDQAAIDIVLKSAPFEPLPPEIAAQTDVLEIIRTWQFRGKLSTLG